MDAQTRSFKLTVTVSPGGYIPAVVDDELIAQIKDRVVKALTPLPIAGVTVTVTADP